jgi:AcrR family transcriptional regulator
MNNNIATTAAGERHLAATKTRLLDTAERLFAEFGVEATSIRDITTAAGASLGAVTYHFGTKQELVTAIFARHLEPVNRRRLALLDEAEQKTHGRPVRLEILLEAMIRPVVENSFAKRSQDLSFKRLMGRCAGEPNRHVGRLVRAHFEGVMARFVPALQRVLPGLSNEEMRWRIGFTFGALHHALLISSREDSSRHPPAKGLDAETLIRRLVAFAAAGMKTSGLERS